MMAEANWQHWIRELRGRTGLTQEKFAARVGVTFPTINRWENGHARPSPLALRQLEALLEELAASGTELRRYAQDAQAKEERP